MRAGGRGDATGGRYRKQHWGLVVTMGDATGEHYSMFFCEEKGIWSSLRGMHEVIEAKGLFCLLYTDRAHHYWYTPKAGGKVDKGNPTQFERAMRQLGIEMIPAVTAEVILPISAQVKVPG